MVTCHFYLVVINVVETRSLLTHSSLVNGCAYVYIVCKLVNIFNICEAGDVMVVDVVI